MLTSCSFFLIEETSNSLAPTLYSVLGLSTNHEGQEESLKQAGATETWMFTLQEE